MPARVSWHRAAVRDLAETYGHIGADSPLAAERFVDAVEAAVRLLLENPRAGRLRMLGVGRTEGIRSWALRELPSYLVFYRVDGDTLGVLRLLHGARDLPSLLEGG